MNTKEIKQNETCNPKSTISTGQMSRKPKTRDNEAQTQLPSPVMQAQRRIQASEFHMNTLGALFHSGRQDFGKAGHSAKPDTRQQERMRVYDDACTTTPRTSRQPPTKPRHNNGIVIHGVPLRKDLEKCRKWLETENKEIGQSTGIRWLRKKTTLEEEGKKTSSVVLYTTTKVEIGKVRLGGRWLRTEAYGDMHQ
ncbi:hypothetical protein BDZ91DRAFT_800157 [Kalaharituber pfeilii]|nr:hypothetical protein BDZ91DRAFT_800157 [Kalaharituber pfeilii]